MREVLNRFVEKVRDRVQDKKRHEDVIEVVASSTEADWEMSSNDALRASIVSGYK